MNGKFKSSPYEWVATSAAHFRWQTSPSHCQRSVIGRRQGFTLVELLVVIAVFALLAAILLPALAGARAQADLTVCKNNLRQFGLAINAYVGDCGAYPFTDDFGTNYYGQAGVAFWVERLEPYTHCLWPASPTPAGGTTYACPGYENFPGYYSAGTPYGAYGVNAYGVSGNPDSSEGFFADQPIREVKIVVPSQMVLSADADGLEYLPDFTNSPASYPCWGTAYLIYQFAYQNGMGAYEPPNPKQLLRRHLGRWNTVFCDDHVEGRQSAQLFQYGPPNDQLATRWNLDHQPHEELMAPPMSP
jgi:prepilin-type N-terminal cleavage/methylation domain-containing protein